MLECQDKTTNISVQSLSQYVNLLKGMSACIGACITS